MSEPDSANNTPLEARQVGTTAQLECFYRRLKKLGKRTAKLFTESEKT